jgi:hypothetical protein
MEAVKPSMWKRQECEFLTSLRVIIQGQSGGFARSQNPWCREGGSNPHGPKPGGF